MKLSNQQIEALADFLVKKECEKNKPINEKRKADAKERVTKKAKELMKKYKTLPNELVEMMYNIKPLTEEKIINNLVRDVKLIEVDKNSIRQKVILSSIETKTLEELKNKFNIEF